MTTKNITQREHQTSLTKMLQSQRLTIDNFSKNSISPIPIIYKKIQNDKKMRMRLKILGHKQFSKVSACGEDTSLTLESLVKSDSTKYIRKLEFDPYLCERSHVKPLSKLIRRFKDLIEINLVIRRLDYLNESDILKPFVTRQKRLIRFKLELNRLKNLDDIGIINLGRMYGRLFLVQEIQTNLIGMDHISPYADARFGLYKQKLRKCIKNRKTIQKSSFLNFDTKVLKGNFVMKLKQHHQTKELDAHIQMPQGWVSMSSEADESLIMMTQGIAAQQNVERIRLRFCRNPMSLETIINLSIVFPKLNHLDNLCLEFLNSQISEDEVMIFAQMLPQLKTLERLRFKVIQYPNVSEGCIYFLIDTISKLPNIKYFEIYFRRLHISTEAIQELLKRIGKLRNIQCCYSRQSLSFCPSDAD